MTRQPNRDWKHFKWLTIYSLIAGWATVQSNAAWHSESYGWALTATAVAVFAFIRLLAIWKEI